MLGAIEISNASKIVCHDGYTLKVYYNFKDGILARANNGFLVTELLKPCSPAEVENIVNRFLAM